MKKLSLCTIAFLQASGLVLYCLGIGAFMQNANRLFGPPVPLGPALFLMLFVVSAIICAGIFFYYPFILFFERKQTKDAVKLVICSSLWFLFFTLAGFLTVIAIKNLS